MFERPLAQIIWRLHCTLNSHGTEQLFDSSGNMIMLVQQTNVKYVLLAWSLAYEINTSNYDLFNKPGPTKLSTIVSKE